MKDYATLVANKKWTALMDSLPANRTVALLFPDGRAMESFKAMCITSNRRGERRIRFSVRMDYRQNIVTVITTKLPPRPRRKAVKDGEEQ